MLYRESARRPRAALQAPAAPQTETDMHAHADDRRRQGKDRKIAGRQERRWRDATRLTRAGLPPRANTRQQTPRRNGPTATTSHTVRTVFGCLCSPVACCLVLSRGLKRRAAPARGRRLVPTRLVGTHHPVLLPDSKEHFTHRHNRTTRANKPTRSLYPSPLRCPDEPAPLLLDGLTDGLVDLLSSYCPPSL
jgi:hypothetical protein